MKKLLGIGTKDKIVAPVGTEAFLKEVKEKYKDTVSDVVILGDDLYDSVLRYDEIRDIISKLNVEKHIIEHTIMASMQIHETAYIKERKITWKKSQRSSVDTKRLKEEEPTIYDRYRRDSSSRVFNIK